MEVGGCLQRIKNIVQRHHPTVTVVDTEGQLCVTGDTRNASQECSLFIINIQFQLPVELKHNKKQQIYQVLYKKKCIVIIDKAKPWLTTHDSCSFIANYYSLQCIAFPMMHSKLVATLFNLTNIILPNCVTDCQCPLTSSTISSSSLTVNLCH